MVVEIEVRAVKSAAKFARQQSDNRELRPLTETEGFEQLLLSVFNGDRDRIGGGNRQGAPRAQEQGLLAQPSDLVTQSGYARFPDVVMAR